MARRAGTVKPMTFSKVLLPFAAVSTLLFSSNNPRIDQPAASSPREPALAAEGGGPPLDTLELELFLEGYSVAFSEAVTLVRSIYKAENDDLADADISGASNMLHKDRAIQLLESNRVECSVGYCQDGALSAALGYRHVSSGRDIIGRVLNFHGPFFSTSVITIVIHRDKDYRYRGYTISG